jgi:response regulator RpfG family c-di-GMP phosphodiesterase
MKHKILFVDDDPNILESYRRQLRKEYAVDIALGGEEGLAMLTPQSSYAVIVSDLQMPGMNGIEFLAQARVRSADSVRVMLTGNADLSKAIGAINEGNIFRFLTKPYAPEDMLKTMEACVEQWGLIVAERELLEKTLKGCMKLFTEILSMVSPLAYGRAARARRLSVLVASTLQPEKPWQLEIAAMLSQVGCVTIPNEVLKKVSLGERLEADEKRMIDEHPLIGANLIAIIPRLDEVAEIVKYQQKHYDGRGVPPDGASGQDIPFGARVLHAVLDYDRYLSISGDAREALREVMGNSGYYDPAVMRALEQVIEEEVKNAPIKVSLNQLKPGMILADDINSMRGVVLIPKGQEITESSKLRLENFAKKMALQPILVMHVPDQEKQEEEAAK